MDKRDIPMGKHNKDLVKMIFEKLLVMLFVQQHTQVRCTSFFHNIMVNWHTLSEQNMNTCRPVYDDYMSLHSRFEIYTNMMRDLLLSG